MLIVYISTNKVTLRKVFSVVVQYVYIGPLFGSLVTLYIYNTLNTLHTSTNKVTLRKVFSVVVQYVYVGPLFGSFTLL